MRLFAFRKVVWCTFVALVANAAINSCNVYMVRSSVLLQTSVESLLVRWLYSHTTCDYRLVRAEHGPDIAEAAGAGLQVPPPCMSKRHLREGAMFVNLRLHNSFHCTTAVIADYGLYLPAARLHAGATST